jgi:hypothetical protein
MKEWANWTVNILPEHSLSLIDKLRAHMNNEVIECSRNMASP